MKPFILVMFLFALLCGVVVRAADSEPADDQDESKVETNEAKPLEGVKIEAVETYAVPKNNELGLAFGLFPFNSYFTGFSLDAFYDYRLNKTITWEIFNASYVFSISTDLTSQLADTYHVNPETIEKMQYLVSTGFLFTHTRGKLLFLDDFIRTFSSSVIVGVGMLNTSEKSEANANLGLAFDAVVSDTFTWRFEFRDMITISGRNFAYFTLGTGVNF